MHGLSHHKDKNAGDENEVDITLNGPLSKGASAKVGSYVTLKCAIPNDITGMLNN